jgi:ABC-type dipeptide/oligopeptide/nickel transport system permease component
MNKSIPRTVIIVLIVASILFVAYRLNWSPSVLSGDPWERMFARATAYMLGAVFLIVGFIALCVVLVGKVVRGRKSKLSNTGQQKDGK